jgi:tRNA pseudouridine38-40 synthase
MPRYRIAIEYDGTPFVGWQVQDNGPSVQGRLAQAIAGFCGENVIPRGAGRTDAGVHALGQVAHFDLEKDWATGTVRDALNSHLRPDPIAVLDCEKVGQVFDARFSALRRHYLYRIVDRRTPLALERNRAWQVPRRLDTRSMNVAAKALIGRHDFTTFRSVQCQAKSPVKTLDRLDVKRQRGIIHIEAQARSFLHNQVRSMVGALKLVGEGKWRVEDVVSALEAHDRAACAPVAPAHGLYLMKVDY